MKTSRTAARFEEWRQCKQALIWNTNCAYEILQKNYISFVIKILHSKRTLLNAWIQFCKTLVQRVSSLRSHQTQQNKFYGFHPWQANLSTNFLRHNSMLQSPKHGDVSICSFQSLKKFSRSWSGSAWNQSETKIAI